MTSSRILVTGGAGFIGSHVVDQLIEAGHAVAIVDDLSTGSAANLNPRAAFFDVDILDRSSLAAVFDEVRPDVVSHQAARASVQESLRDPIGYGEVNVIGSLEVLEQCRRVGVRKIIYASTGGAGYGEPQWLPVTEDHPMDPLDPYGAGKHHVEHYLSVYRHNHGLHFTTLRYANVYGPRQDPYGEAGVIAIFAEQMVSGRTPIINGDGEQARDFVFVGDVARANVMALDTGDDSVFNVGTGRGTTVNEIFRLLREAAEADIPEVHGPPKSGEVRIIALEASKARHELGWEPAVMLPDGLAETVAYFRDRSAATAL